VILLCRHRISTSYAYLYCLYNDPVLRRGRKICVIFNHIFASRSCVHSRRIPIMWYHKAKRIFLFQIVTSFLQL